MCDNKFQIISVGFFPTTTTKAVSTHEETFSGGLDPVIFRPRERYLFFQHQRGRSYASDLLLKSEFRLSFVIILLFFHSFFVFSFCLHKHSFAKFAYINPLAIFEHFFLWKQNCGCENQKMNDARTAWHTEHEFVSKTIDTFYYFGLWLDYIYIFLLWICQKVHVLCCTGGTVRSQRCQ